MSITSTFRVLALALVAAAGASGSAAAAGIRKLMPAKSAAHDRGRLRLVRRICFLGRALMPVELFISRFPFFPSPLPGLRRHGAAVVSPSRLPSRLSAYFGVYLSKS